MKNGKVLLVTGGGRGIGAQIALGAAKAGWHVAVNYAANADAAATVVEHIEAAGGEAFAVKGDIGSEADVLAMFAASINLSRESAMAVSALNEEMDHAHDRARAKRRGDVE